MKSLTMQFVRDRALAHLRRDLTLGALDDFLPLSAVLWEVRERLDPESEVAAQAIAMQIVRDLLGSGVVTAGDLVDGALKKWDGSIDTVTDRIEMAIQSDQPTEAAWLIATEKAREWLSRYEKLIEELRG
jgi:hypothetical protein